jgi:hypothetical protein
MTGDRRVYLYVKKILGIVELGTWALDYLRGLFTTLAERVWGASGFFTAVDIDIDITDEISLTPQPDGADNAGHMVKPVAAHYQHVPFENTAATTYHVALGYAERAYGVEQNPRTGEYEYRAVEEVVGVSGVPDAVAVAGAGLSITVDTITEVGVSNAGRTVLVYLNDLATPIDAVAFEECVVAWDGANNKITTVAQFGQAAPSVVPGDYTVILLGPRIARNTDLRTVPSLAYVGNVTGGGAGLVPAAKDTSDQRVFFTGGVGDLADVLTHDGAGHAKIEVKAYGAEAATDRQIAVLDVALGTRPFYVDKAGNVAVGQTVSAPTTTLGLADVNVPVAAPLSSATDTAIDPAIGNILRAVNQVVPIYRAIDQAIGEGILDGGECTDGGGLQVDYTLTYYCSLGRLYEVGAGSIVVPDNATTYVVATKTDFPPIVTTQAVKALAFSAQIPLAEVTTLAGAITNIVDIRRRVDAVPGKIALTVGPEGYGQFETIYDAVRFVGVAAGTVPSGTEKAGWDIVVVGSSNEPGTITIPVDGISIRGVAKDNTIVTEWAGDQPLFDLNGRANLIFADLNLRGSPGVVPGAGAVCVPFLNSAGAVDNLTIERVRSRMATRGGGEYGNGFFNMAAGVLSNSRIRDCITSGYRDFGINLGTGPSNVVVSGCRIQRSPGFAPVSAFDDGILFEYGEHVTIVDCEIANAYANGVDVRSSSDVHVERCAILMSTGAGGAGVYVAPVGVDPSDRIFVVDNTVKNSVPGASWTVGVYASLVENSDIRGNKIVVVSSGIIVNDTCEHVNIVDNHVEIEATAPGSTYFGVAGNGTGLKIRGNYVEIGAGGDATTNAYGVWSDNVATYCVIDGNETILPAAPVVVEGIHVGGPGPIGDYTIAIANQPHGAGVVDNNAVTTIVANNQP